MADWKKLAASALLSDGKIDNAEVKIIKKELFADNVIDDEKMQFLVELRKSAASKARAAKAAVTPAFEKLFLSAVEKHVLTGGKVDADKAKKLETILGKPSDANKKFVAKLKALLGKANDRRLFRRAGEEDPFATSDAAGEELEPKGEAPAALSGAVHEAREGDGPQVPAAELWRRLRDRSAGPLERLEALQELLHTSQDEVTVFLVEELAQEDLSDEWRDALVFVAEDAHFPAPLRQKVGERLFAIASELRLSTKAGAEKVVWSAMRRAFSLLPPDPTRVLPFLKRQGPVDTRAVALRCIERAFEPAPPGSPRSLKRAADRVEAFASKFLDPDVFDGGESAVIAQSAVCALAALGDPRLAEAIKRVKSLGRRWLNRQLRVRLEQLLASWKAAGEDFSSHPALRMVEEQIQSLS